MIDHDTGEELLAAIEAQIEELQHRRDQLTEEIEEIDETIETLRSSAEEIEDDVLAQEQYDEIADQVEDD